MIDDSPLKSHVDDASQHRWLITFTDLIALLLAFFVMLFSMSEVEPEPWENMTNSLVALLNPDFGWDSLLALIDLDADSTIADGAADLDYLQAVLSDKISNVTLLSKARLTRRGDHLIISLAADSLFAAGSAGLGEDSRAALYAMGDTLRHISNRVDVNGHTDPSPVRGGRYPSNWELSLHRAVAVAEALASAGYTRQIIATGLAESRFEESAFDGDREQALRHARRVDVIIRETQSAEGDDDV